MLGKCGTRGEAKDHPVQVTEWNMQVGEPPPIQFRISNSGIYGPTNRTNVLQSFKRYKQTTSSYPDQHTTLFLMSIWSIANASSA